ncbi:MAG: hypothetical protein HC910_20600 [Spirulinaceae cyanobacterium SM2_1_0]|nr:hypothetical protein [Spirulinaceae cyanobacterium SM2_1_0]
MKQHSEAEIMALEEHLRQAMPTSNVAELEILIAPELLFTTYRGHQ